MWSSAFSTTNKGGLLVFFSTTKMGGKCFHIQEHRQSSCAFETTCAPLSCAFSKAVKRFFNHKERRSSAFSTTNNGDQALFQPKINMLIYFYNHKQCDLVFFSVTSKRWSSVSWGWGCFDASMFSYVTQSRYNHTRVVWLSCTFSTTNIPRNYGIILTTNIGTP